MAKKKSTENQVSVFDKYVSEEKLVKQSKAVVPKDKPEKQNKPIVSEIKTTKKNKTSNDEKLSNEEKRFFEKKAFDKVVSEKVLDKKGRVMGWDKLYPSGVIKRTLNPHGEYLRRVEELKLDIKLTDHFTPKLDEEGNIIHLGHFSRGMNEGFRQAMGAQARQYKLIQKAKAEANKSKKKK